MSLMLMAVNDDVIAGAGGDVVEGGDVVGEGDVVEGCNSRGDVVEEPG